MENDIALVTILEHLRAFEARVNERFASNEKHMNRMERNLTRQIDAIDKRLDMVEIERLPKRVARLEHHAGFVPMAS